MDFFAANLSGDSIVDPDDEELIFSLEKRRISSANVVPHD
jgi:hypothetical protein